MRVWDVSSNVISFISDCFLFENKMWFIHLYIGQNQYDTCANIHWFVPHEITFNPTDDTAHDDELSNSFASSWCVYNHGSHYMYNQMHNHHNKYTHSNSAIAVQYLQPICSMLPPVAHEHDQNQHHINVPMTITTANCIINCNTWIQRCTILLISHFKMKITQRKNVIERAEAAVARLNWNSVASPNSSI